MILAESNVSTAYAVADALLRGEDPAPLVEQLPERLQRNALNVARSIVDLPLFHAERIAKLEGLDARRRAIHRLPKGLREGVKIALKARWGQGRAARTT